MIDAVATSREIQIDTPSPSTAVLPLELCAGLRPVGRLLLLGQAPTLAPFRALCDARLWMQWVEPEEGLEGAHIEIAAQTSCDERARTARVVARAALTDRKHAWALYRLAEAQGFVDLLLAGSDAPAGSPQEVLHLLVCADLSQRSSDLGLSVDPFPRRYQ